MLIKLKNNTSKKVSITTHSPLILDQVLDWMDTKEATEVTVSVETEIKPIAYPSFTRHEIKPFYEKEVPSTLERFLGALSTLEGLHAEKQ